MVDMDFKINLPFDVTFCRISLYHFLIIPSTKNTHTHSLSVRLSFFPRSSALITIALDP